MPHLLQRPRTIDRRRFVQHSQLDHTFAHQLQGLDGLVPRLSASTSETLLRELRPRLHEIAQHLEAGRDVAALCEGDPFFYGSFMYLFERLAGAQKIEVVPGVSSPMACAAALAAPLAARNDVLSVLPAPLDEDSLTARLEVCDAAAIVKVGRHIGKVRCILQSLDLETRARYIERASLPAERILPLSQAPDPAPYFSMVLVHRRGEAWK